MEKTVFSKNEKEFIIAMGMILGLRELSMTMLNPFISIYGRQLRGSTPFLCGFALGIYGLTNAIFQIPYGRISDKYGRKPIILVGLMQLIIGMLIAYIACNIYTFIIARALQGSGAVMAIAYSWMGDNIEDSKKNRAMGIAGTIVALGAVIAFGLGPLLYKIMSVSNMFLSCSILIFIAWLLIFIHMKEQRKDTNYTNENIVNEGAFEHNGAKPIVKDKLRLKLWGNTDNKNLFILSSLGFINNFILSTMFFISPPYLEKNIGGGNMWCVFLPAILIGIFVMRKFNLAADKGYFINTIQIAILMLFFGMLSLSLNDIYVVAIGIILILTGFMCLTSEIPSAVNKIYDKNIRGYANGVLQTFTFLGFFAGPTLSGLIKQYNRDILLYIIPILLSILGWRIIKKLKTDKSL